MIKRIFLKGLQAFVPVVLTFTILVWAFNTIENLFSKVVKLIIPTGMYVDGMGILIGIVFIFVLGILLNAWIVHKIYQLFDGIIKRLPVVKSIYNAIVDFMGFFGESKDEGKSAVIVSTEHGRLIGFVTRNSLEGGPTGLGSKDDALVYIPMSYQIGGFTVAIPREKLEPLDMSVEKAMSFVMTAGITQKQKS